MKNFFIKLLRLKSDEEDRFNYKGWLNSEDFVKRALAVYGYGIAGYFIFAFMVFIVVIIFALFLSFLGI